MSDLADEQLYGMRILVAAVYQQLFLLTSRFKNCNRQFHIQHDRDHSRENEHDQQRRSFLTIAFLLISDHGSASATSARVWPFFTCVSSTRALVGVSSTTK